MSKDFDEDIFDNTEASEVEEEEDDEGSRETAIMKGYEEEIDDPYEDKRVEEEAEF